MMNQKDVAETVECAGVDVAEVDLQEAVLVVAAQDVVEDAVVQEEGVNPMVELISGKFCMFLFDLLFCKYLLFCERHFLN